LRQCQWTRLAHAMACRHARPAAERNRWPRQGEWPQKS